MIPPLIERHVEKLRRIQPGVQIKEAPGVQAVMVEIPDVQLPKGWNKERITVRFLVPLAYPAAPPDCFWVDEGFALEGGRMPQGSRLEPLAGVNLPLVWFSWHVQQWDPNTHTVSSFFQVIKDRLGKVQ